MESSHYSDAAPGSKLPPSCRKVMLEDVRMSKLSEEVFTERSGDLTAKESLNEIGK